MVPTVECQIRNEIFRAKERLSGFITRDCRKGEYCKASAKMDRIRDYPIKQNKLCSQTNVKCFLPFVEFRKEGGAKCKSKAAMGKEEGLWIREGSGWGEYDRRRLYAWYS